MGVIKGKLIVIDGVDFCGKTTQINLLSEALTKLHIEHIVTHEPRKGKPIGDLIYEYLKSRPADPYTMALLYTADRNEHIINTIRPALDEGITVIADRYHCSTVAYQGVHYDNAMLWLLGRGFPEPDLVFIIDGKPEILAKRDNMGKDVFENDLCFQSAVRLKYLDVANNREEYILIAGHHPPEEIHSVIMEEVDKIL